MDKNKHSDLMVLQSAELTERTPFCPDDQEIAEYYEGHLAEFEHQPIERHLTDCRFCLARIGMLNRQQEAAVPSALPRKCWHLQNDWRTNLLPGD